jgi:hypothetical protein
MQRYVVAHPSSRSANTSEHGSAQGPNPRDKRNTMHIVLMMHGQRVRSLHLPIVVLVVLRIHTPKYLVVRWYPTHTHTTARCRKVADWPAPSKEEHAVGERSLDCHVEGYLCHDFERWRGPHADHPYALCDTRAHRHTEPSLARWTKNDLMENSFQRAKNTSNPSHIFTPLHTTRLTMRREERESLAEASAGSSSSGPRVSWRGSVWVVVERSWCGGAVLATT